MPSAGVRSFNGTILLVNGWRWWRIDWCIFFFDWAWIRSYLGRVQNTHFRQDFPTCLCFVLLNENFIAARRFNIAIYFSRILDRLSISEHVRMSEWNWRCWWPLCFFFRRVYESIDSSSFTEQIEKQRIPFLSVSLVKSIAPRFASKVLNDIRSLFAKGGREKNPIFAVPNIEGKQWPTNWSEMKRNTRILSEQQDTREQWTNK